MIKNKKFILRVVMSLFVLSFLVSQSQAALQVDFLEDIESADRARIQWYWDAGARTANVEGQSINDNPDVILDLDNPDARAKVDPTPRAFHFGCDEEHDESELIHIRVWDDDDRGDNDHYSVMQSFGNVALGSRVEDFGAITYSFVRAAPGAATITGYNETGSTNLVAGTFTRSVTFNSSAALVGVYTVEIARSRWHITYPDGSSDTEETGGTSLSLSTADGDSLNPGDTYTLQVEHQNLWGTWTADLSAAVVYEVGAGPAVGPGGPGAAYRINLRRIAGGHGVNSFSIPRAGCEVEGSAVADVNGTVCANAYELVNAINRIQGGGAAVPFVRVFGSWDAAAQVPIGVTIDYDGGGAMNADDRAVLEATPLTAGQGYQVYIRPEVDADINITFDLR